jgi:hypothetical protein
MSKVHDVVTGSDAGEPTPRGGSVLTDPKIKEVTPYNAADYKDLRITIAIGDDQFSTNWNPRTIALADLVAMFCDHKVGEKDGRAVVLADMVPGNRRKPSIKSCTAIGIDDDTGTPSALWDAAIADQGRLAVRTTTHSHNKTLTDIKKDSILKFRPDVEADGITTEIVREYARDCLHWHESIYSTAEYVREDHNDKGIVVFVKHAPMPKHRIMIPLETPFVMATEARLHQDAMAKWAKIPAALADLMGMPFDKTCVDPSRLFYLPRHDKARDYEVSLFGGPLFDFHTLNLDNMFDAVAKDFAKGGSKSVTPEGRALGKWWIKFGHRLQITDLLDAHAEDKLRGKASSYGHIIECPFDSDHSNAGDPDDPACYAVNAAEGGNEYFIVKCQHNNCADKKGPDYIAKMVKDSWFDAALLEDEEFNLAVIEDAPDQKAATKNDGGAAPRYLEKIIGLNPDSTDAEVDDAIRLMLQTDLSVREFDKAEKALAKALKLVIAKVRNTIAKVRATTPIVSSLSGKTVRDGKKTFKFDYGFNFEDAARACKAAVLEANAVAKHPAVSAMVGYPVISVMDGYPVLLTLTDEGRAKLEDMTKVSFWSFLTSLVAFVKVVDGIEGTRDKVPEDVATYVFETCSEWLPPSPTIAYTPTFLSDGSLLETPGYHFNPEFCLNHLLILSPDFVMPAIPEAPTKKDALRSLRWLRLELMNDFPFIDTDAMAKECREPAEANAWAMLFTPHMRPMIPGRTPVFMVGKPKGGTGGSLFSESVALIHEGKVPMYVEYTSDPDEMSKRLITAVRSGTRHLIFDDVEEFVSKTIHRAVTSPKVGGRRMATNDYVEADNNFNWSGSGNNPILDDQMDRRTVWVRMNAKKANVGNRKFRHSGEEEGSAYGLTYEEFCQQFRGTIISHILTIILYWRDEGKKPFSGQKPFSGKARSGFNAWSKKVGGVLESVGIQGFLQGKSGLFASPQAINDAAFMQDWVNKYGTEAVKPVEAFQFASGIDAGILRGNGQDQRKARFFADLHRLTDQAFVLKPTATGKDGEYEFKSEADTGGAKYWLQEVAE